MVGELENLAQGLGDMVNGKGGFKFEQIMSLLATEQGKRVFAMLMSDGGERIKRAAQGAKRGDMSGVQAVISAIAETEEGKRLLIELMNNK